MIRWFNVNVGLKMLLSLVLIDAFLLTACTATELQRFKNIYNAGANSLSAFSATLTALANEGKLGASTAADVAKFTNAVVDGKSIIAALDAFPPANSAQLRGLLAQIISALQTFIHNGSTAGTVLIAALNASLAFFETTSDMLPSTSSAPAGAAKAPKARPSLDDLDAKRKAMQKALKEAQR